MQRDISKHLRAFSFILHLLHLSQYVPLPQKWFDQFGKEVTIKSLSVLRCSLLEFSFFSLATLQDLRHVLQEMLLWCIITLFRRGLLSHAVWKRQMSPLAFHCLTPGNPAQLSTQCFFSSKPTNSTPSDYLPNACSFKPGHSFLPPPKGHASGLGSLPAQPSYLRFFKKASHNVGATACS